jgi:hypothetical protein
MSWFKKKPDPISDRARVLNDEIALLEVQIQRLDAQLQDNPAQPRLRSTVLPRAASLNRGTLTSVPPARECAATEPIFEDVDRGQLTEAAEPATTPSHFNDLGVRKYDLPALLNRVKNQFRGPSTTNPKLVSYLAAGGLQGLRPLRYEKRVARNRFIALSAFLFLMLLGALLVYLHRH